MTEGEAWTRKVLGELRDARYRPGAWWRFLAASFQRSSASASRRLHQRRQTLVLATLGVVPWVAFALAGHVALGSVGFAWWTLVIAMLWWHLGMLESPSGVPLPGLGSANIITMLRVAAIPVLPALNAGGLGVLVAGLGLLDVADGALARRRAEVTRLGVWLDGAADTVILGVAAVSAARVDALPWWIAGVVLARVALPWGVVTWAYFARAAAPRTSRYISARIPGAILTVGVVIALIGWPAGATLAACGALAAIATFVASIVRTARESQPGEPAQPSRMFV